MSSDLLGGLTWEAIANERRPRRLKRGSQFTGDVREVERAATAAAQRMGMAVRCVRDDFRRNAYLWVQFVDHELPLGEPCPRCASREIIKTHDQYGRCPGCGASFAFVAGVVREDTGDPASLDVADPKTRRKLQRLLRRQLDSFADVELTFDAEQSDDEQEVWYGRARYEDDPVLIRVTYPLREGVRQPHPDRPEDDLHFVAYWHLAPIARAAELGLLDD